VSALAWLVVAAVLVRMASGGGTLTGLDYVLTEAPTLVIVAGTALLIAAVVLFVALLGGLSAAPRASLIAAVPAIAFGVAAGIVHHESGWVLAGAAVVAVAIGIREAQSAG
jgi:hypothetical protein